MSMVFNRTEVIPVWLLAFGLFVLLGSPMTFSPGLVLLLTSGVALTIMRALWQKHAPTVAAMTAPGPLLATHPSTHFVSNSWPNSGFRNINVRNRSAKGR